MAAVRDIITHVEIETAAAKRICHHDRRKHSIPPGQKCLAVYEHGGGRKNYCVTCALAILAKATAKMSTLERDIRA